jgi:hypothetical protein
MCPPQETLSILAVGDSSPPVDSTTYRAAGDQTFHREGMPLGTRGGLLVEHYFPADGTYGFDINLPEEFDIQKYGIEFRHKVILAIDGVRLFETELGGTEELEAFDRDLGTTVASIRGTIPGASACQSRRERIESPSRSSRNRWPNPTRPCSL